jgi:hypothetical protein
MFRNFRSFIEHNANQLMEKQKLSNCHLVIDGSNFVYQLADAGITRYGDFDVYATKVRNFFQVFLDHGISPHVLFDGPAKGINDGEEFFSQYSQ